MTKTEKALDIFSKGFNCAQSVFAAFASELGVDEELALKLASSFGGGARNGEMCGAVSGALMVIGLKYGHYQPGDNKQKSKANNISFEFTKRFREANKSIVCRELLGYDLTIPEEMACIKEKNLFREICPKLIMSAVTVLEGILKKFE